MRDRLRRRTSAALSLVVGVIVARRSRLPRVVNRTIEKAVTARGPWSRLVDSFVTHATRSDVPQLPAVPDRPTRLYVGPTNYAGQGELWARAVESARSDAGAVNMAFTVAGGFNFPADNLVPAAVYLGSRAWQEGQRAYVREFTHVLYEAERPLFGRLHTDAFDEARALIDGGLAVAMMCHGTDIRLPSRHAAAHAWSPFTDPSVDSAALEAVAVRNRAGLDALGAPVFVSTPDLLADVPYATWCPVVVDPARWADEHGVLVRDRPLVVHAPSKSAVKGSDLIEPAVRDLAQRGLIEYERVEGVDSAEMPALYTRADVVLDQFRIGSYGVAACEAMAAGRVVLGHVTGAVRAQVRAATGRDVPIVEATPDSIGEVLLDVLQNAESYRARAAAGPDFVAEVHDGRFSARVLESFLGP